MNTPGSIPTTRSPASGILTAALICLGVITVSGQTRTVFETGFEPDENYDIELDLIGQNGWVGVGTGGTGLVADFFEGLGQQAYIGFSPPDGSEDFLSVWRPLNLDPVSEGVPLVRFDVVIEIVDSENERYDDFRWSVYNKKEERLFTLDFDNVERVISYALDGSDPSFVSTGFQFGSNGSYELSIFMNFGENLWNATLNDVTIVQGQPMTTADAELTLGDIDAVWAVRTPGEAGDNFMLFDNYRVTASNGESLGARLTPVGRLEDGRFLLRVFGEAGRRYAIEASTDLDQWLSLKEITAPEPDGVFEFLDDTSPGTSKRFYRTRLVE